MELLEHLHGFVGEKYLRHMMAEGQLDTETLLSEFMGLTGVNREDV